MTPLGDKGLKCFCYQIGNDPKEARYWLRQFQNHESAPDKPFAVVQVDSEILNNEVMVSEIKVLKFNELKKINEINKGR